MTIEVGVKYLTRCGDIAIVTSYYKERMYPFVGSVGNCAASWLPNGRYNLITETSGDLIKPMTDKNNSIS